MKKKLLKDIKNRWLVDISEATNEMIRISLAKVIQEEYINDNWINTNKQDETNLKLVNYLCTEYLPERQCKHNLIKLNLIEQVENVFNELNINLNDVLNSEIPPREGVGGLSRLASCLGEAGALLDKPFKMYGIKYKEGLFYQDIKNGYQVELVDRWRTNNEYEWQIFRPNKEQIIKIGGTVEMKMIDGRLQPFHKDYMPIKCLAYDMPIVSADNKTNRVNTLRMWKPEGFNINNDENASKNIFNSYDEHKKYLDFVDSICDTLYPNDKTQEGRDKRFIIEMILTIASVNDIVDSYISNGGNILDLGKYISIQINDTMPMFSILELMRILVDEYKIEWEMAENICKDTFFYSCHTILSEALQKGDIETFRYFAPRHLQILEEMDKRDNEGSYSLKMIQGNIIHYANICLKFSKQINGVAPLHGEVLREKVFKEYHELNNEKVIDILNGVDTVFWLKETNKELGNLLDEYLGKNWFKNPYEINNLINFINDKNVRDKIRAIKYHNKQKLTKFVKENYNIDINPHSTFTAFCKRVHLYKRNDLYICLILHCYNELLKNKEKYGEGLTFFMSGKSAFGYEDALDLIKIYNEVANMINNDNRVNDKIKVVFLANYGVDVAEALIPALDIKADISCVLYEASGSSCFKAMANGSISIGTDDGANVDIIKEVGLDNFYKFGMEISEAKEFMYHGKYYDKWDAYSEVADVMDYFRYKKIPNCYFECERLWNRLINIDTYFVMKDLPSFEYTFDKAIEDYKDRERWITKIIYNIGRSGHFSIIRTFQEYCDRIWGV